MKTTTSNFYFLKDINRNIYKIVKEAEGLYRDEYFQQTMTQTRCFAENVTKELLNGNFQPSDNFDTLLSNLDDYLMNCEEKRELIADLYFLKKAGNMSAHTRTVDKDGIKALECLQRSFEVAVTFYSMKNGGDKSVSTLLFDEELLVTGKRSKDKNTLKEKYLQAQAHDEEMGRRKRVQTGNNNKKKRLSKFDRTPVVSKSKPTQFFTASRKIKLAIWLFCFILSLLTILIIHILIK